MTVSSNGKDLIKWFESLRLSSYRDVNVWSIGYGSRSPVNHHYTITREEADRLFDRDIVKLEKWLNIIILRRNPTQHEFDAIASWTYNVGHGSAFSSNLIKKYNSGTDSKAVAYEFTRWAYIIDPKKKTKKLSKGLLKRRKMEQSLFLNKKLVYF